jgi:2-polyprenyl-6-methoxyphenol hydroxylase-like FAD-dependent oxidoreductase
MNATTAKKIQTTCAITGGGPAGMMLGFLLARAGVKVVVLEKHQDFPPTGGIQPCASGRAVAPSRRW